MKHVDNSFKKSCKVNFFPTFFPNFFFLTFFPNFVFQTFFIIDHAIKYR